MARHTISIYHVEQALQGALRHGLSAEPLLLRAGISPALLDAPIARVSQDQYGALLHVLRRRLRDDFWGLLCRPLPLGCFAHCCRLLVQAPTLGDALRTGLRYFHGEIDEFVPRLRVAPGMATIGIFPRAPEGGGSSCRPAAAKTAARPLGGRAPYPATGGGHTREYAQRAFLFLAFGVASWLVARRVPLASVEYRGTPPEHGAEIDRQFQAKVAYGCRQYCLNFESRWLQLPQVQNAQSLREFLAQAPTNLLVKYRDRNSVTDRIRRLLRSRLHDELPSLESVASTLAMTPQTLSRRLREEGQGFQALKDDLRRDAAIELLQRPDLTLLDIAGQLGFSEASTFHRAFKKWTGVAPGEYRHRECPAPRT